MSSTGGVWIPIKHIEDPNEKQIVLRPGYAWYAPWWLEHPGYLAPLYYERNSHRPPIMVVLPDGVEWCVDGRVTNDGKFGDHGWDVSGDIKDGTLHLSPSIKIGRAPNISYHGYIDHGRVGEDIDGPERVNTHRAYWGLRGVWYWEK